jgi:methylenetetrahydrofolate dehydrogenase (NADP+) / methenyltetrahydrofolate cyclohydrolase
MLPHEEQQNSSSRIEHSAMTMRPLILDGRSLAARRLPLIAAAARRVRAARQRAPVLLLVAFADGDGTAPHVGRKQRAAAAAGIDVVTLLLGPDHDDADAHRLMASALRDARPDAVFVQVPVPPGLDEARIMSMIPAGLDVDVMTGESVNRFMTDAAAEPPLTVAATLRLLDEYRIDVRGLQGVVAAEPSDFAEMFRMALQRRGADMAPLLTPDAPESQERLRSASLVVAALARPSAISASQLAAGAIALDIGYFNAGGRGDIDTSEGAAHLGVLMPVPGGVGPMTVSMLLERVVQMSGAALRDAL